MKRRKDAETMFGASKREVFKIPRGDTLSQKDHANLSKQQPSAKIDDRNLARSVSCLLDANITRGLEISHIQQEENEKSSRETLELLQEFNQSIQYIRGKVKSPQ